MGGPWEKYQQKPAVESGPWSKYQQPEPAEEKGMIRRAAEAVIDSPALPIAGGVMGGIAGMGAGSVPLAALGGAGGEAIRQLGARALGMDAPETSMESIKDIGASGISQGAGQAVGLGLGKAAGMASKMPIVKTATTAVKKSAGDIFQLVTKNKPRDAATLFNNPKAILPSTMAAAREEWKAAAKEIGLPVDQTTPAYIKALKNPETAFDTFEKIANGEKISALEAQIAKKVVKIRLRPTAVNERNKELVAQYDLMAAAFTKRLSEESPRMAAANKGYAIASSGKKFRSLFARNQNDTPAYIRSSVLPLIFGGANLYQGNPVDAMLQAGGVTAASSPLALGSLIALLGAGKSFGPAAGKTLAATLAEFAKERFER